MATKTHNPRSTWNTASVNRATRLSTLGVLAGGIAHEFNNLMTPTAAAAQAALASGDAESQRAALRRTLDAIERSQRIIGSILKLASGGVPPVGPVSIMGTIETAIALTRLDLARAKIRLRSSIPHGAAVQADEASVLHVLINLILNSSRAMRSVGGVLSLSAEPVLNARGAQAWQIRVADTGPGISPEQLTRLLDPDGQHDRPEGTGLGLQLCDALVAASGGELSVSSTPGTGTTVTLTLPAWSPADRAAAA